MIARGTFLMMVGQGIFLLSGLAINLGLGRFLGPGDYGTFGFVMAVLVGVEHFVITGIPELIQKYGGANPQKMYLLKRATLPWQLIYSIAIFAVFWILSESIAQLFNDPKLTTLFRIAAFDIVFYGLFKYYQALQNGLHDFEKHAVLGIAYAVSKVCAVFGLVFAGFSLNGALVGNMLGSVGGLIAGLAVTRMSKTTGELDHIPYIRFIVPNILFSLGFYLFFSIDIWFVKYFQNELLLGYYVAAAALSKIPYVFSIALSAALLPSISRATKEKDERLARELIQQSMRYVLMFLLLFCVLVMSTSQALLVVIFGQKFAGAAPALSILIVGLALITLLAIFNTILISRDQMSTCFAVTISLVGLDVVANYLLIPRYAIQGAAVATTLTAFVGVLVTGTILNREVGSFILPTSVLKMASIALIVFAISAVSPAFNSLVLVKCAALGGLYFAVLWLIGEINSVDIDRLKSILVRS